MNRLGLCVVGCGSFAQTFCQGIEAMRSELDLYFASRDLSRAQQYATTFHAQGAFGSYEEAAADPRVEAMYVCTPHHLHEQHVYLAASAGKHVLVGKPMACSLDEGRRMIAVAESAGVTLMVAENYRFMPQVRTCKELVDCDAIGDLRLIQLQEEAHFTPEQWRTNTDQNGGGVFIDGGIHKVHFLRYMAGEPENVFASALPSAIPAHEGEDGLVMMVRWASGLVGVINHSWTGSRIRRHPWVAIAGIRGRIYFEPGQPWLRLEQDGTETIIQINEDYRGLAPMVREFRDSIREGRNPEVSGADGLGDLKLVLKAYESAERNMSLPLT